MEQFVAYENKGVDRLVYPYLINMQHPVANVLNHALVIPVTGLSKNGVVPPKKVCPVVMIKGQNCVAYDPYDGWHPFERVGLPYSGSKP